MRNVKSGIHINKKLNAIILFFILILLISCKLTNNKDLDRPKVCCELIEGNFYFDKKDFPELSPIIKEFEETKSYYGILHIQTYSFSANFSVFQVHKINDSLKLTTHTVLLGQETSVRKTIKDLTNSKFQVFFNEQITKLDSGFFFQKCYSSVFYCFTSSHVFFVKKEDKTIFKYAMDNFSYKYLMDFDKEKIKTAIPIINTLYDVEGY